MQSYRNVTEAFYLNLKDIFFQGDTITVRGQETKELLSRSFTINIPQQRVYIIPDRNNNIFCAIAETLWVVGGRNDLDFLSHYLPRAADFSDDGKTWRASYGKRLRDWYGIDQIKKVAELLNKDNNSRRAVSVIFDPSQDYTNSLDIPCNNWLHFFIRDGNLHLNIAVRSCDIIWGFTGINAFEWSVIQEMVAYWTNTKIGPMTFFISSFHLYERHYKKSAKILQDIPTSVYEFGIASPKFNTPLEEFDGTLSLCYEIERGLREKKQPTSHKIIEIKDDLLRIFMQMLDIYNKYLQNEDKNTILKAVNHLPFYDFRVAAIEFFSRHWGLAEEINLSQNEESFFVQYKKHDSNHYPLETIIENLKVLHYKKTLVYKDSWKKHGEVIGILANISRKFDRLESVFVEKNIATADESIIDTLADLAVYSGKYLTYIAEHYPNQFQVFVNKIDKNIKSIETFYGNVGFDPICDLLMRIQPSYIEKPDMYFAKIQTSYHALEDLLLYKNLDEPNFQKCQLSAEIFLYSILLLLEVSQTEPVYFKKFIHFVKNL